MKLAAQISTLARLLSKLRVCGLIVICALSACAKTRDDAGGSNVQTGSKVVQMPGAWVSGVGGFLNSEPGIEQLLKAAAGLGIGKMYVDVWSNGCVPFDSQVAPRCKSFDFLPYLLSRAKLYKIRIVPWLEWGLHVPEKSPLAEKLSALAAEDFHGMRTRRLNPFRDDTKSFFKTLVSETRAKFPDSTEIHLCDNLSLNADHFIDYRNLGGSSVSEQARAFTVFMDVITKPARAEGVTFSLSTHLAEAAYSSFRVDWTEWKRARIVTEVIVELYHLRSRPEEFWATARHERDSGGAYGTAIYAGSKNDWSMATVARFFREARDLGMRPVLFDLGSFIRLKEISDYQKALSIARELGTTPLPLPSKDSAPATDVAQPGPAQALPAQSNPQTSATDLRLCQYMKVSLEAPKGGAPLFMSQDKGAVVEYIGAPELNKPEVLVLRHATKTGADGELMMHITVQSGAAKDHIRWVQAKYLVERFPGEPCRP